MNPKPRMTRAAQVALAATLLAATLPVQADSPSRGRDPWAFRMILENKTRMLVLALRPDLWAAYNPANGTLHKVWSGGIQFRGKVWDFGQANSRTLGTVYHLAEEAFILTATDETIIPSGWSASGVTTGSFWTLGNASATLTSPTLDLRRHDNVILSYFTAGNNRLLVEVSANGGTTWDAQHWLSIQGAAADGHQKMLTTGGDQVRFRFKRGTGGTDARLSDITLYGDHRSWTFERNGVPEEVAVDWLGYRLINRTEGIVIRYDAVLADQTRIGIEEKPEALPGAALSREFTVSGLPAAGRLSLKLDGTGHAASHTLTGDATLRSAAGDTFLDFEADGAANLNTTWTP